MEQQNAYTMIGFLIGGLVAGFLCGSIPLVTGFIKKRLKFGFLGFISCIIGGLILGLILALPVAVVFTLIIFLKKGNENFTDPPNPPNFNE